MDILNQIERLKIVAEEIDDNPSLKELEELRIKQIQAQFFVAVVGLFKRGKSTLLNALLDGNILPSAVTPVTAIITLIEYADKPAAEIYFSNGVMVGKELNEIKNYVTEDLNPGNEKEVDFIKIYYNASILKLLSFVDTPGVGSVFEHNTQTTKTFIPKIDAAVFVLSADMPVSKMDIDFLNELKDNVPKILLVLNKSDLLTEDDMAKMLIHNSKALNNVLNINRDATILVSAKNFDKPEGNIQQLIAALEHLVDTEKYSLLQKSVSKRYENIRQQLKMQVQLRLDAMLMPLQELEQKQIRLRSSVNLMNEQKAEFESIINSKIKLLQKYIHDNINVKARQMQENIIIEIQKRRDVSFQRDKFIAVKDELDILILNEFEEEKNKLEEKTKEEFAHLLIQYSQRSQSFLNELASNLNALLGINFSMIADKFDMKVYTSFYLTLDADTNFIDGNSSFLHKLLPASIRNKQRLQKIQDHYDEVIVRNTAAIAYDLQYKIQESFRKFNYDLNNYLEDIFKNIEKIIQDTITIKTAKTHLAEEQINNLKDMLIELRTI